MTRLAQALMRAQDPTRVPVPEVVPPPPSSSDVLPAPPPKERASHVRGPVVHTDVAATHTDVAPTTRHGWFGSLPSPEAGRDRERRRPFPPKYVEKVVTDPHAEPTSVEQYRRLAAALHQSQRLHDIKVVMVTSAVAGEGKSLTAVNLALTFSQSYRRNVLLMDADLRRPTIDRIFQISLRSGLSDALRAPEERQLQLVQVRPRLMVLPAGRSDHDPMGGLASPRMSSVINEAASIFDWVLIDTPPVGLLSDAKLLASMVDAALLVVLAGRSPCALINQAVDALGRDKVFGVVLNGAETTSISYGAGYYYNLGR